MLVAAFFLERGFHLLAQNYRRKSLELDLVLLKGQELLVIEVKTRSLAVDDWQQLIPPRKLAALWRGADRFLLDFPEYGGCTVHLGLALVRGRGNPGIQWMRLPSP